MESGSTAVDRSPAAAPQASQSQRRRPLRRKTRKPAEATAGDIGSNPTLAVSSEGRPRDGETSQLAEDGHAVTRAEPHRRNRRRGPRNPTRPDAVTSQSTPTAPAQRAAKPSATNSISEPESSRTLPDLTTPCTRNRRQQNPAGSSTSENPQRGGRGYRGQRYGIGSSGRVFGAQLSVDEQASSIQGSSLAGKSREQQEFRPDAPSFEPGRPLEVRPNPPDGSSPLPQVGPSNARNKQTRTRQRGGRGGRGRGHTGEATPNDGNLDAEDIMSRIHREIASGDYECMVCYGGVTRRAKIWYCRCCWAVYHLNCIKKWAKQGLDQPSNRPIGGDGEYKTWKCPGCNDQNDIVPDLYTCWCEKSVQLEVLNYLPPHSCGQSCGKQRTTPKKCPHNCGLQCHAGPCPPCTSQGPPQPCYCAKEESQRRCSDTDYENGWSCGQTCGDLMPCGEHNCPQSCHPGLCGACEVTELLRCYCGNEMKDIKCCDKAEPMRSKICESDGEFNEWEGYYQCSKVCDRPYDCGVHDCGKPCHALDEAAAHCPLSPDVITHCPCGKTRVDEILPNPRNDCQAPIPTCEKTCGKLLQCGHQCSKTCHEGECGVCLKMEQIPCRCGKTSSLSLCRQGDESEAPLCLRSCRAALNCGRHVCGEKCCAGEQKSQERLSVKKKMRPYSAATPGLQTDDGFEPEHICTRTCGKLLKCGRHDCEMLCHRGPCATCLQASFDELTCNCGRTSIDPPVPCGSRPPVCRYPCTRAKACGHPIVQHDCHTDEESCPKCPYLMEKLCTCGKKTVKAIPCFREIVSCGTRCGKKLSCGSHSCRKVCHEDRCEEPCKQQCGKPKSACGHACMEPCHAPFQCSEEKPCAEKVQLRCSCGGLKQDARCGATKSNPECNLKELRCTDVCRSRRLAMAFQLDPDREGESLYSDETIAAYSRDRKWSNAIEEKFRSFAANPDQRRLQFQPMRAPLREFLHNLAEDFGLESESQDPEPYRSVVVRKGPSFSAAPRKTLADFLASKPMVSTDAPVGLQQLKKARGQAVNCFVLQGIKIGLLASELEKELLPTLNNSQLRFTIGWHGDEDVLLSPKASSLGIEQVESELRNLCPQLKRTIASKGLADSVELCWVGADGRIANTDGERWSLVNNKRSAPPMNSSMGIAVQRNRFDMTPPPRQKSAEKLGKVGEKPKEVVDDWEMEAEADEEAEKKLEEKKVYEDELQKLSGEEGLNAVAV